MYNDPANNGLMVGGNAFFLRPCASCPTGVSTVSAYLGCELRAHKGEIVCG